MYDGRVKPDVVAPGTWILSTRSKLGGTGWGVYNDYYIFMGGTSMATPITAGFTAVVRQFVEDKIVKDPSASLLKALLIASAIPLGDEYPSKDYGWGRVDMGNIIPVYMEGDMKVWDESQTASLVTGQQWTTTVTVVGYDRQYLKVVLVWSDYPSFMGAEKNLVNDLDLIVIGPDGKEYRPVTVNNPLWGNGKKDFTNNVEVVRIPIPEPGNYKIVVKGGFVPMGPQPFSLVAVGDFYNKEISKNNMPSVVSWEMALMGEEPIDLMTATNVVVFDNQDITITATDDAKVGAIKLYIDKELIAQTASDRLSFTFDSYGVANGTHTLSVKVIDIYGKSVYYSKNVKVENVVTSLRGHVDRYDSEKKRLVNTPGIVVILRYLESGQRFVTVTDNEGNYEFTNIPTGLYRVAIKYGIEREEPGLMKTQLVSSNGKVYETYEPYFYVYPDKLNQLSLYISNSYLHAGFYFGDYSIDWNYIDDVRQYMLGYYKDLLKEIFREKIYDVLWISHSDLNLNTMVVYYLGNNGDLNIRYSWADVLNDEKISNIKDYLEMGGNLWMIGTRVIDVAYLEYPWFFNKYFGIAYDEKLPPYFYTVHGVGSLEGFHALYSPMYYMYPFPIGGPLFVYTVGVVDPHTYPMLQITGMLFMVMVLL